jgi:hypothetical protein
MVVMRLFARLGDFSILALLTAGMLVSPRPAGAADALVLQHHVPTLQQLAARAPLERPAATATAEPICDIFANGYDAVGATPCAGCFDATVNFDETDVDCGGTYCKACADGQHCATGNDCSSTVCNTATTLCAPVTCLNNTQDGDETDIDCGGSCPACPNGKQCGTADSNCTSNVCDFVTHACVANRCLDQRKDGAETDIDCGGGTCATCASGKSCSADADCSSTACDFVTGTCAASQCLDHHKDGAETDIDCGGGVCPTCANTLHCGSDADCASNACDAISLTCVASQCSDHRQDGSETDVDCGGANLACARCTSGQKCLVNGDCAAGHTCSVSSPRVCL